MAMKRKAATRTNRKQIKPVTPKAVEGSNGHPARSWISKVRESLSRMGKTPNDIDNTIEKMCESLDRPSTPTRVVNAAVDELNVTLDKFLADGHSVTRLREIAEAIENRAHDGDDQSPVAVLYRQLKRTGFDDEIMDQLNQLKGELADSHVKAARAIVDKIIAVKKIENRNRKTSQVDDVVESIIMACGGEAKIDIARRHFAGSEYALSNAWSRVGFKFGRGKKRIPVLQSITELKPRGQSLEMAQQVHQRLKQFSDPTVSKLFAK